MSAPRVGRPATLVDRTELRIGVPRALRRRLRALADRRGESEAAVVRAAIEHELGDEFADSCETGAETPLTDLIS